MQQPFAIFTRFLSSPEHHGPIWPFSRLHEMPWHVSVSVGVGGRVVVPGMSSRGSRVGPTGGQLAPEVARAGEGAAAGSAREVAGGRDPHGIQQEMRFHYRQV